MRYTGINSIAREPVGDKRKTSLGSLELCVISNFLGCVNEVFALLGCYAELIGNCRHFGKVYRSYLQGSSRLKFILKFWMEDVNRIYAVQGRDQRFGFLKVIIELPLSLREKNFLSKRHNVKFL
jgi:hypothetical protein